MKRIFITIIIIGIAAVVFFVMRGSLIDIGPGNTYGKIDKSAQKTSSIAGLKCDNAQRRPVAVMMPSDPEAKPLSGISAADLVMEMPVTPNGVTRFMAIFQCQTPKEIGSVRSAREDFIP